MDQAAAASAVTAAADNASASGPAPRLPLPQQQQRSWAVFGHRALGQAGRVNPSLMRVLPYFRNRLVTQYSGRV